MSNEIQPYLFFGGRCAEALEFYKSALGATVEMLMRFDENPMPVPAGMLAPGFEKKVMHSSFLVNGARLMASDGCRPEDGGFHGFSLVYSTGSEDEARKVFGALSEGGAVTMPLGKTFFSPCYGMVKDRFDVSWQVMVPGAAPA
jgi:PhnB protein